MSEIKEKKVDEIKKEADALGCPLNKALYYVDEFLKGPMCGRCFPCSFGSFEARVRLRKVIETGGTEDDLRALNEIARHMAVASMCKKGKDTAKFINEYLEDDKTRKHHADVECPDLECAAYIEYRIDPEKCINCDKCKEVCKDSAIIGEKKETYFSGYLPYEIRQKRCTKCGECIKVCPTDAVVVVAVTPTVEVE